MQQISLIQEAQEAQDDDIVCVQEVAAKIKKEPTATQKMIAERFVITRKSSGFKTEKDAILRFGLKNEKVISQIENLHRLPTIEFVIRASNAYGVSADYLLGLSEDDDRSSDVATRSAIFRQNQKMVEMFSDILSKTSYDYAKVVGDETIKLLADTAEALYIKFTRFCQLNPEFENMRGGAPVQHLMLSIIPTVKRVKKRIHDRESIIELHNKQLNTLVQRQLFGVTNG